MTVSELDGLKLFFIVGRIRSGTTLLNNVLNSHEQIFVPQESPFILFLHNKYSNVKSWNEATLESFFNDLWFEHRLTQFWGLDVYKSALRKVLISLGEQATFRRLCKAVILFQAQLSGKSPAVIGDKNPSYTLYMPLLKQLFPDAKFLSIVRDPRSNILSCKRVSFDASNTAILAERWNACSKQIMSFEKNNTDSHFQVRYEYLLGNPEESIISICSFLQVDFKSELLNFYKLDKELSSWNYFELKNFDTSKIDDWKKKLSNKDLNVIQYISKNPMLIMGYKLTAENQISSLAKLSVLPKLLIGSSLNIFESWIYYLPLRIKAYIIDSYRVHTKTKSR